MSLAPVLPRVLAAMALALVLPAAVQAAPVQKSKSRLQAGLATLAAEARAGTLPATAQLRQRHPLARIDELGGTRFIAVDLVARQQPQALAQRLQALGARGVAVHGRVVSARLPVAVLPQLELDTELLLARPAMARTRRGAVLSQGDIAIRGPQARALAAAGLPTGAGLQVGVLSDSFNCLGAAAADVSNGEYPSVTVLRELNPCDGSDEGRAMVQLVADVAPGSTQMFYTAFEGEAAFANGIAALADAGADVIVDDIGYFAAPYFHDGIVAQAVDRVVARGVPYFSAAGNDARNSYESVFRATAVTPVSSGSIGMGHDFDPGPGVDIAQGMTVTSGQTIALAFQWDDAYASSDPASPGAASDLDIYLLNANGQIVASSDAFSIGGDAFEFLEFTNFGANATFTLRVELYAGPAPGRIKYINVAEPAGNIEYDTASGTSYGHPVAAGAFGVGAAFYRETPACGVSPPLLEGFSSPGGTPILLRPNGTRLPAPVIRQKPDAVGPDGANTTFFGEPFTSNTGPAACRDTDGLSNNFFGTSAAAPHVAAVAALMLDANPTATPAQIYAALRNTAVNMGPAGFDFDSGFGLVRAEQAVAAIVPTPPSVTLDTALIDVAENAGTVNLGLTLSATSAVDVTVPFTFSGLAVQGSDYTLPGGPSVTIPAGSLSGSLALAVVNDVLDETVERATLTMGTPTNATAGARTTAELQIRDNDPAPVVTLSRSAQSITEGGAVGFVDVRLSAPSGRGVIINLVLAGTASNGADYTPSATSLRFVPGVTTRRLRIAPLDDALNEPNETVQVSIGAVTGATVGAASTYTATLVDTD